MEVLANPERRVIDSGQHWKWPQGFLRAMEDLPQTVAINIPWHGIDDLVASSVWWVVCVLGSRGISM